MTRIDPYSFTQAYLGGSELGMRQAQNFNHQQQIEALKQERQARLEGQRQMALTLLRSSQVDTAQAATAPHAWDMADAPQDPLGWNANAAQQNKDVQDLERLVPFLEEDGLRYLLDRADDAKKRSETITNLRYIHDNYMTDMLDPNKEAGLRDMAIGFAAAGTPEAKVAWLRQKEAERVKQQEAAAANQEFDRRQGVMQAGREVLQKGSQAFQATRDKAKAAAEAKAFEDKVSRVSQNYQTTRGWSKEKADAHAYLVLSNAENEPASLGGVRNQNIEKDPDLREANQKVADIDAAIKRIEDSGKDDVPVPADVIARRTAPLRQQRKQIIDAANARYRALYGGGESAQPSGYGLPQTTSTTPTPGAPTQAGPVADDATVAEVIKTLTARLGREPSDEEIDAAMGAL